MSETLAAPDVKFPPTQAELPDDDGIPMESQQQVTAIRYDSSTGS